MTTIDAPARAVARNLVRNFRDGTITNYALEDAWPTSSTDPSLVPIEEQLWLLYSDGTESTLKLAELSQGQQAMLDRIEAFLESNCVYLWPSFSFRTGNVGVIRRLLGFGSRQREQNRAAFMSFDDISKWPFTSQQSEMNVQANQ